MSTMLTYNTGNPNSPKFNLFGYVVLIGGFVLTGLGFVDANALGLGIVGLVFGGVVVTSTDGVLIDLNSQKLKGYTSFYGYKYGDWENLRNYGSVTLMTSRRVWKLKHMSSKYSDVSSREFVVCIVGKSHVKRQIVGRFDSQNEAMAFATEVSAKINLPIERHQGRVN